MRESLRGAGARLLGRGRRLRVGFVGCGEHARANLYPCLAEAPVELVAVCARRRVRAERAARTFGARAAYDDYAEMFAKEPLEAVFVCVSAREHARIAAAALHRGLHVFVEKPATETLEEAAQLRELEKQSGRHVMVAFMKRHAPAYRRARELAEGMAPLAGLDAKLCIGPCGTGDVFVREVAVHHLDLARFLAGEVQSLHVERHAGGGGITLAVAARFHSGAVGTLCLSSEQSWHGPSERVELFGAGQVVVVDNVQSLRHYPVASAPGGPDAFAGAGQAVWEPNFTVPTARNHSLWLEGFAFEVQHFVESILAGRKPAPGLLEWTRTLQLVEAVLAAAAEGGR